MTKIILSGCNGRMGRSISRIVEGTEDAEIVCGFDIDETQSDSYPVFSDYEKFTGTADVVIDFSNPANFEKILAFAKARKMAVVLATTGLSAQQRQELDAAAAEIPVFFSANMSVGVNLVIELAARAAALLSESFDIEIIEKHHNQKLDAPSGTALAIADAVCESVSAPHEYVYDRHSVRKKRDKNEIGIHAVRGGTIVGEHEVLFAGKDEVITISHSASSREVFAEGAVRAARFMTGKPAGFYNMKSLVALFQN